MAESTEQKLAQMFDTWLSPKSINFINEKAEKQYKDSIKRIQDVIQLKVPDRVPVYISSGFLPAYQAGITSEQLMYDYDKLADVWKAHIFDVRPDLYAGSASGQPGKPFELLDYQLYLWPGHGTAPNAPFQCVEKEYMRADEYDALIQDPSDFFMRSFLPRIFKKLEPFSRLVTVIDTMELPFTTAFMASYGLPEVRNAFDALLKAGEETIKWRSAVAASDKDILEAGYPMLMGGSTKAPFDTLGDTLRGTRGIMLDMFRQPKKVLEAMDRLVPIMIKIGVSGARATGRPLVMIPLHKGADGFMSEEQYKKFYWPTFREVIIGLIDEGVVPYIFAEGAYNNRLEIIKDIPRGKTIWHFDYTDMIRAKEVLADTACIMGNVPISLLGTSTPEAVKDYCKKLIDFAGKGGGFIMAPGAVLDTAIIGNIKTMIEFTREYGVY